MDDRQAETRLKRYRPAGPPDSLRERCLTPVPVARVWPWAAAAAALLVIVVGLQAASTNALAATDFSTAPDPSAGAIADLAEALGGDEAARRMAEQIIALQLHRDRELAARSSPLMGETP